MNRRKKILFIMTALNGGGAENVLSTLLCNIDYTLYEVELLLTFSKGVYLKRIPENVVVKTIYHNNIWLRKLLMFLYRRFGWKYGIKLLLNQNCAEWYDTIISFMEGEPLLYHSMLCKKSLNNVTWVHIDLSKNYWSKKYFYKNEEYDCYNMMNHIAFVSKQAKVAFSTLFKINSAIKQSVVYNIVDSNLILSKAEENPRIVKRKFTICASGRLEKQKAFHRLVEIAQRLKDKGYDFDVWILGMGSLYSELDQQIRNNDLLDVVHLLGFCDNPYPIMKQADLFISTSITEGFPIVICEALIIGLPILATKVTGTTEILEEGKHGVLSTENIEELTNKTEILLMNRSELVKYAHLSVLRANQLFDLQRQLKDYYKIW